jgi:hypothetical protein
MSLDVAGLVDQMTAQAAATAGASWSAIQQAATTELQGLAQRLVLLTQGYQNGEVTKDMVQSHLKTMRYHVIATIAMLTVMVEATIEKIINSALTAVRDAINQAIGFKLIA